MPDPWQFAILALAAFRLTRLAGWDDFPLVARPREWITSKRDWVAHMVGCPFCVGFWISLTVWLVWVAGQNWTLAALAPFAISGAVGLIAKNLDP